MYTRDTDMVPFDTEANVALNERSYVDFAREFAITYHPASAPFFREFTYQLMIRGEASDKAEVTDFMKRKLPELENPHIRNKLNGSGYLTAKAYWKAVDDQLPDELKDDLGNLKDPLINPDLHPIRYPDLEDLLKKQTQAA